MAEKAVLSEPVSDPKIPVCREYTEKFAFSWPVWQLCRGQNASKTAGFGRQFPKRRKQGTFAAEQRLNSLLQGRQSPEQGITPIALGLAPRPSLGQVIGKPQIALLPASGPTTHGTPLKIRPLSAGFAAINKMPYIRALTAEIRYCPVFATSVLI